MGENFLPNPTPFSKCWFLVNPYITSRFITDTCSAEQSGSEIQGLGPTAATRQAMEVTIYKHKKTFPVLLVKY